MYALYVAPMGAGSDMKTVANGLAAELQKAGLKVAQFQPIGQGVAVEKAAQLLASGNSDQLMEDVIGA